jgi:PAS domain S-box-containing protein
MTRDVVPIGTIISDLDQRILQIDDRFGEIVGRERRSLIGKRALSFTYAEYLPANRPVLDRLAVDGPGFTIVKRYVRGDGGLVWVRNHVTRITDGHGAPVLCATAQPTDRPFGSERLARHYKAAQRLCGVFVTGRRQLSPEVVWAPAIEALLWLYRAEIEGRSLDAETLAALTATVPGVMVRWVRVLQERGLVMGEQPGPLDDRTCIRISAGAERALDGLLAGLTG